MFLYEYSDGSMRAHISRDCSHELLRIRKVGDCSQLQLQLHRQPWTRIHLIVCSKTATSTRSPSMLLRWLLTNQGFLRSPSELQQRSSSLCGVLLLLAARICITYVSERHERVTSSPHSPRHFRWSLSLWRHRRHRWLEWLSSWTKLQAQSFNTACINSSIPTVKQFQVQLR